MRRGGWGCRNGKLIQGRMSNDVRIQYVFLRTELLSITVRALLGEKSPESNSCVRSSPGSAGE